MRHSNISVNNLAPLPNVNVAIGTVAPSGGRMIPGAMMAGPENMLSIVQQSGASVNISVYQYSDVAGYWYLVYNAVAVANKTLVNLGPLHGDAPVFLVSSAALTAAQATVGGVYAKETGLNTF